MNPGAAKAAPELSDFSHRDASHLRAAKPS